MKIKLIIYTLFLFNLAACGKGSSVTNFTDLVSLHLLQQTESTIISELGETFKRQSRTGNMTALYFKDRGGNIAVVLLKNAISVEITVCPYKDNIIRIEDILPSNMKGWKKKRERRFSSEVDVYNEEESGFAIFEDEGCIYITTNWDRD